MTKHKRTNRRRSQKGGFSLNPLNWFSSSDSDPNAPGFWDQTKKNVTSGMEQLNSGVGSLGSNIKNTVADTATSINPFSSSTNNLEPSNMNSSNTYDSNTTSTNYSEPSNMNSSNTNGDNLQQYAGKRRRRRCKTMKGGLGLTYYASPVSGLKVASPNSWQFYANGTNQYSSKGGSRKRKHHKHMRKSRRNKRR